ncbi:hypothetical protein F5882DRAFT_421175 [Hyaloscypha sp. PMI_1271]|nr:hypothetical protein F5882DRAFT_421175 [Hyaloscypha sp. PMI_1271]
MILPFTMPVVPVWMTTAISHGSFWAIFLGSRMFPFGRNTVLDKCILFRSMVYNAQSKPQELSECSRESLLPCRVPMIPDV